MIKYIREAIDARREKTVDVTYRRRCNFEIISSSIYVLANEI